MAKKNKKNKKTIKTQKKSVKKPIKKQTTKKIKTIVQIQPQTNLDEEISKARSELNKLEQQKNVLIHETHNYFFKLSDVKPLIDQALKLIQLRKAKTVSETEFEIKIYSWKEVVVCENTTYDMTDVYDQSDKIAEEIEKKVAVLEKSLKDLCKKSKIDEDKIMPTFWDHIYEIDLGIK